jgi:hypothetical protein
LFLAVMIAGIATSIFFASRYSDLDRTIERNRAAMSAHLKDETESSGDASLRVAKAVESDESLFDETLVAMSARRTAGFLSLGSLAVALVAIAMVGSVRGNKRKADALSALPTRVGSPPAPG